MTTPTHIWNVTITFTSDDGSLQHFHLMNINSNKHETREAVEDAAWRMLRFDGVYKTVVEQVKP